MDNEAVLKDTATQEHLKCSMDVIKAMCDNKYSVYLAKAKIQVLFCGYVINI